MAHNHAHKHLGTWWMQGPLALALALALDRLSTLAFTVAAQVKITSAGDFSIFLHDNVIYGHHFSKDTWLQILSSRSRSGS